MWFVVYLFFISVSESTEDKLCSHGNDCVPLSQCEHINLNVIFPCHNGLNLYCCPSETVQNSAMTKLLLRKRELFPTNCGISTLDYKITGGKAADLGQFPWMALLGYKQKHIDLTEFLCGGTVITDNYILTAAHCLDVGRNHKLDIVRLGEHNLQSQKDCETSEGVEHCSDTPIDLPIKEYWKHPKYDWSTLKDDIALIKVARSIPFTNFIQPICLPFEMNLETKDLTGQKFFISGWGKTESRKVGGSSILQYAQVQVWNQSDCKKVIPANVQFVSSKQLCANGKREDACKGDSGGPLANFSLDSNGEIRSYQIGIVSFASTMTCGVEELPPVYTRVDKYLDWIIDSVI